VIDPVVLDYFRKQMTVIDFAIIALGLVLVVMQGAIWLSSTRKRLFRKADSDPLVLVRSQIQLQIVSSMIELLPYLGIFGTVYGLMSGLFHIQAHADPTIKDIAARLAPALSTTFFGLIFAIVNTFVFNFLAAHLEELLADYRLRTEQLSAPMVAELVGKDGPK